MSIWYQYKNGEKPIFDAKKKHGAVIRSVFPQDKMKKEKGQVTFHPTGLYIAQKNGLVKPKMYFSCGKLYFSQKHLGSYGNFPNSAPTWISIPQTFSFVNTRCPLRKKICISHKNFCKFLCSIPSCKKKNLWYYIDTKRWYQCTGKNLQQTKLSSKNSDDIKSIFVEEVRSQEC